MTTFHEPGEAREWTRARQAEGRRVGFVPTMGALHEGHIALVRRAKELADDAIVSIFVNPTQFGQNEDFSRYPRTLEADVARLEAAGVGAVFAPDAAAMYPPGFRTAVTVQGISDVLEGAIRPGHFQGVATVVAKLFGIVPSDAAVFGQKDYQQLLVIRRMAQDLNLPVEVVSHPTVREPDGLAMSSRNRFLNAEQRQSALALSRALSAARAAARDSRTGEGEMEAAAWAALDAEPGVVTDYAVVVDPETLAPLTPDWQRALCLVAGRLGNTRLIDNTIYNRQGDEVSA